MNPNTHSPLELRTHHLKHESALVGIGSLYYLGGVAAVGLALAVASAEALGGQTRLLSAASFAVAAVCFAVLGRGFRLLHSGVRWPATIVSALGLLWFPVGTLVGGYVLFLIHSAAGRAILSPEYKAIIAATPELKRTRSILGWFFLGFIVLLLLIALQITIVELFRAKNA